MSQNLSHQSNCPSSLHGSTWSQDSHGSVATAALGHSKNLVSVTYDSTRHLAPLVLAGVLSIYLFNVFLQGTVLSPFRNLRRPTLKGRWSWVMGNLIGELGDRI